MLAKTFPWLLFGLLLLPKTLCVSCSGLFNASFIQIRLLDWNFPKAFPFVGLDLNVLLPNTFPWVLSFLFSFGAVAVGLENIFDVAWVLVVEPLDTPVLTRGLTCLFDVF